MQWLIDNPLSSMFPHEVFIGVSLAENLLFHYVDMMMDCHDDYELFCVFTQWPHCQQFVKRGLVCVILPDLLLNLNTLWSSEWAISELIDLYSSSMTTFNFPIITIMNAALCYECHRRFSDLFHNRHHYIVLTVG